MQQPNILLAILGKMAQKPAATFDKLFPKLYNVELWLLAYERIAPKPGNMTAGIDGRTIDGAGQKLIANMIENLKTARYKPLPTRRVYIPKANGQQRPLGIPSFPDKLLQTVVKLILEAIYEPTFSTASHGFRPGRSCHTALVEVKRMNGIRWWVEGDIKGFFDNLNHDTLLRILAKRIKDQRFVHLIGQFLKAGYIENWQYQRSYSGTPQGGNLSPILSNIYLNELDQAITQKTAEFNKGTRRQVGGEYNRTHVQAYKAKQHARRTGNWTQYKALRRKLLTLPATEAQDPHFRRLQYVRYADDFLVGVIGSKADANALKEWLTTYLKRELQLDLSAEKTLVTNSKQRIPFLGYEIRRWHQARILRYPTRTGVCTKRTTTYQMELLLPRDKCLAFSKEYGNPTNWQGKCRSKLINLSELEIQRIYNAEVRGFLGYYSLADNLKAVAAKLLWLTTGSFFRTLAGKRKSTLNKVAQSMKRGPGRFVLTVRQQDGTSKEYELVASTRQVYRGPTRLQTPDQKPNTMPYRNRTELGQRLQAAKCEWCGTRNAAIEVHHVRKLGALKGKTLWERQMIERRRKTMVLCAGCHDDLHAGRLRENNRQRPGEET